MCFPQGATILAWRRAATRADEVPHKCLLYRAANNTISEEWGVDCFDRLREPHGHVDTPVVALHSRPKRITTRAVRHRLATLELLLDVVAATRLEVFDALLDKLRGLLQTDTVIAPLTPRKNQTDTIIAPLTPRKNLPAHESLLCTPRPKRLGGRRPSCPRGTVP